jgi:hypothetical protein
MRLDYTTAAIDEMAANLKPAGDGQSSHDERHTVTRDVL